MLLALPQQGHVALVAQKAFAETPSKRLKVRQLSDILSSEPVENLSGVKTSAEMGYEALGLGERGREIPRGNTGMGKVSKEAISCTF